MTTVTISNCVTFSSCPIRHLDLRLRSFRTNRTGIYLGADGKQLEEKIMMRIANDPHLGPASPPPTPRADDYVVCTKNCSITELQEHLELCPIAGDAFLVVAGDAFLVVAGDAFLVVAGDFPLPPALGGARPGSACAVSPPRMARSPNTVFPPRISGSARKPRPKRGGANSCAASTSTGSHSSTSWSMCVIHTGFWGCGAFGGNRRLMTILQSLAGDLAGVETVFRAFDKPGVELARDARQFYERLRDAARRSPFFSTALPRKNSSGVSRTEIDPAPSGPGERVRCRTHASVRRIDLETWGLPVDRIDPKRHKGAGPGLT